MINYVVVNALTPDYKKQIDQIRKFVIKNNIDIDTVIIFANDNISEKEIIADIWTKDATIINLDINLSEYILAELEDTIVDPNLIIFPNNFFGIEISSRIAIRLNMEHINDIISFEEQEESIVFKKMIYMNLVEGEYIMPKKPVVISVEDLPVDCKIPEDGEKYTCYSTEHSKSSDLPEYIHSYDLKNDQTGESLDDADFVIIMGRGFKKRKDVESSARLIESLGAKYGVTRPIAMNGWVPLNRMIGISGEIINPKTCIILGSSCTSAFYAGVEDSEMIVNVNTASNQSLLSKSDIYINSDCMDFINALAEIHRNREGV